MHHMTFALAEQHRSELRGEADADRLARQARSQPRGGRRWLRNRSNTQIQ
jgi:hypothetical protein